MVHRWGDFPHRRRASALLQLREMLPRSEYHELLKWVVAHDKDADNRADVTNEMQEKQKARELREKLQRVVFVKNGDKVRMQKVETGIADSTFIEIKNGVKAGDEVVSGSYTVVSRRLKDGSKVEIEKPGKG